MTRETIRRGLRLFWIRVFLTPRAVGRAKIARLIASAAGPVAFALLTFLVATLTLGRDTTTPGVAPGLLLLWAIGVFCWWVQSWQIYRRRTHQPSLALEYWKEFDSSKYRACKRIPAARTLKILRTENPDTWYRYHKQELEDSVDDVLDWFEDVGFLVAGGQMSPEVANHYFFHWLRGYWLAACDYVHYVQDCVPTQWNHLHALFEIASQVEHWDGAPTGANVDEFLDEELRLDVSAAPG